MLTNGRREQQIDALATWIAIAVFAAMSIAGAISSPGFLEADSCTHYLYARDALNHPHLFVNIWGRPICTGIYALPAHFFGRLGVRFTSLLLAIGIALIARAIARGQQMKHPALAAIFILAGPLVYLHSFSELTELPFAFLLALAFWAYQRRQFFWFALAIGFTPLSRPEGFGFLFLAFGALLLHRRWFALLPLIAPLLLWDYSGWVLYGRTGHWWMWLSANWPYEAKSLYQPGPLLHFVMLLPVLVSPLLFPAMMLGVWQCLTLPGNVNTKTPSDEEAKQQSEENSSSVLSVSPWLNRFLTDHQFRIDALTALIPVMILAGHSVLYWRGKMASNGELRYLLVTTIMWGLLAARGWEWVFENLKWKHTLRWAGAAALFPAVLHAFYPVVPLTLQQDWIEGGQIANWCEDDPQVSKYFTVAVAHPGVVYALTEQNQTKPIIMEWRRDLLASAAPGTLLIWDPIYGVFNADAARSIKLDELLSEGWAPLQTKWTDSPAGHWAILVKSSR